MISTAAIAAALASLFICIALAIVPLVWLCIRRQRIVLPWLAGALAFTVSQILLRLPIIQLVLPRMAWYQNLTHSPVAIGLFLAVTAALFEETARFLVFRFLIRDRHRWIEGIAFGFGHGAVEALLITGLTLVNLIVIFFAINAGVLDTLLAGVDPAARETIRQQALSATPLLLGLGGLERILAVMIHIGMTMIVLTGLQRNRPWTYLAAAYGVHTLVDAVAAIVPRVTPISPAALEGLLAVFAGLMLLYALRSRRHFPELQHPTEQTGQNPQEQASDHSQGQSGQHPLSRSDQDPQN